MGRLALPGKVALSSTVRRSPRGTALIAVVAFAATSVAIGCGGDASSLEPAVTGDHLYMLDNVHGVQLFDLEGTYLSAYSTPRIFSDLDIGANGGVIFSNNSVYSSGAQGGRVAPSGEVLEPLGTIVFPDAEPMGLGAVAEAVVAGDIPDVLRNHTMPIAGPDGSIWAVSPTESLLRHYTPGSRPVLLPELRGGRRREPRWPAALVEHA